MYKIDILNFWLLFVTMIHGNMHKKQWSTFDSSTSWWIRRIMWSQKIRKTKRMINDIVFLNVFWIIKYRNNQFRILSSKYNAICFGLIFFDDFTYSSVFDNSAPTSSLIDFITGNRIWFEKYVLTELPLLWSIQFLTFLFESYLNTLCIWKEYLMYWVLKI